MIEIKTNSSENVIEIEVKGAIMEQDIKDFESYFEQKKAEHGKINLLMVINDVRYSTKGLLEDFKFDKNHWNDFNKIAVVSDKKWIEFGTKVLKLLSKVKIEYFKKDEREKALAGLPNLLKGVEIHSFFVCNISSKFFPIQLQYFKFKTLIF